MSDRYSSRKFGYIVHKLDQDKASAFIKNRLNAPEDAPIHAENMVIVNGEKGLATVITEGVGWYADKNGGIPINYWTNDYGNGGYIDITEDELRTLISDETIDLADHVRVFGDRLETNLWLWQTYSEGYSQDKMSLATATIVA